MGKAGVIHLALLQNKFVCRGISVAKSSLMSNGSSLDDRASVSCGHTFVFEVSVGYFLHDYTGALVGMVSLGLARRGTEEISWGRVLWFSSEIFVLVLFFHQIVY